jgi:hypothetical protein
VTNVLKKDLFEDPKHRRPTLRTELKRIFWEANSEIGPIMLLILGFCAMGLGAINWGTGNSNLAYDNHLRIVGTTVTSQIVEVEKIGGGRSGPSYIPVTVQRVDGVDYRTELDHYKLGDKDDYKVGQKLTVMYNTGNPYEAGIKDDELHEHFLHNVRNGTIWFWVGAVMFGVGVPLGLIQFVKYRRKQKATKIDRRWRKLRRKVKDRRRAARRKAYAAEKRATADRKTK